MKPDGLIGHKIAGIKTMESIEAAKICDGAPPAVIVLDNGTQIYALADEEGNGFGCLNYRSLKGKNFSLIAGALLTIHS